MNALQHNATSSIHRRNHQGAWAAAVFSILLSTSSLQAGGQIPGDCNQDGTLDLSDAVCLLDNLFLGNLEPPCTSDTANERLLDVNGKLGLEIGDAVFILSHLFRGGPPAVLGVSCIEITGCPEVCKGTATSADPSEVEVRTAETDGPQRTILWQLAEGPLASVTYEVVDGLAITEGDIILGNAKELSSISTIGKAPPGGGAGSVRTNALSVVYGTKTWPDGIVPYTIVRNAWGNSTNVITERIESAMEHVEEKTNVRFVRRRGEADYVEFRSTNMYCSAAIGHQGGKQHVRLSTGCSRGSVVHELLHTVGVWHEQSRCDRNDFVEILWGNILVGKEGNFRKHCSDGIDLGDYDLNSIMHYGPRSFGKIDPDTNRRLQTIRALNGRTDFGVRTTLSSSDIEGVNWLYPTPANTRGGTVGSRTDTYDWTSGWTQAKPFEVGSERFLFLLKEETGDVHIHRLEVLDVNDPRPIQGHSTVGEKVADYRWSSGWSSVEFYEENLRTFLILLKESTGAVHIHRMNSDGTVGDRTATRAWSRGWTQAKPFEVGSRQYLFLLKAGNGIVHVNSLRNDGTVGPLEQEYQWSSGWTSVDFFETGGETYLFLLKKETGDVHIQKMLAGGAVGPRAYTQDWSSGWTSARTYVVDGSPYLFLLKERTGQVHVHELLANGQVGPQVWRYHWSAGWSNVEFFELDRQTYLLLLKEQNGVVHLHTMNN
jgi:hypothetical protein